MKINGVVGEKVAVSSRKGKKQDLKDLVAKFIKRRSDGVSIQEIADHTQLKRFRVKLILAELIGAGKVRERDLGTVKLHYWIK